MVRGENTGVRTRRGKGLRLRPRRRPCPRITARSEDTSDSSSSSSSDDDQKSRSSLARPSGNRGTRACTRSGVRRRRSGRIREGMIKSSPGLQGGGGGRGRGKPPLVAPKVGRVKMSAQSRYAMRARSEPAKPKPKASHEAGCTGGSTTSKKTSESCDCLMGTEGYFTPVRIRNAKLLNEIMYEVVWDSGDVTLLESSACSKLFPQLVIEFLETVTRIRHNSPPQLEETEDTDSTSESE